MTLAAVWRGGSRVELERLPVPPLAAGEALVRVRLATVCGSDRHTVSGRRPAPCPSVLGHETVGEIVDVGSPAPRAVDGAELARGARVIWSVTLPCGTCDRCRAGASAKCRTVRKAGHESLGSGWALSGGYAEHVLLPAGLAVAWVPDALPDELAAPAACATATVMATVERAGALEGRRVLVLGAGMLGLTGAAFAASAGAAAVTVIDPDGDRRTLAGHFGATDSHHAVPDGLAVDVVLDYSGASDAIEAALAALDVQGVAVLAGSVLPARPVAVDPEAVVRRQLTVCGSHNYEPRHLPRALDFLLATRDRYPWATLVAPPVPLAELPGLLTGPPAAVPRQSVRVTP